MCKLIQYSAFFHLLAGFLLLSSSCITLSKVKYVQEDSGIKHTKYKSQSVDYLVQKGDNLYIKLSSTEPTVDKFLTNESVSSSSSIGYDTKYKDVYLVDKNGYIKLPQFEKIKVDSLSLDDIRDSIEFKIKPFYSQTATQVRLADNYITIIGDVNKPGRYLIDFRDKINIFELLGMAGDLNFEAKRSEVKLIRKRGNETEITIMDLTKPDILESEYYYVLPNDVVYVEPLKETKWHLRSFPFATTLALVLSTTTTILVIITYFK